MGAETDTARRLLVVDDEQVQRLIVTRAMASLGFATDSAASLEEAVNMLAACNYHVIVLDLWLGECEGISLLPAIAASASDPIVIFMSQLDDRIRAASVRFAAGLGLRVAGAIAKPVTSAALRDLLDRVPHQPAPLPRPSCVPPTRAELATALDQQKIVAAYQPKISLSDGRVVGVEALARWNDPPHGPAPPDVFIPLAEASGLIIPLTRCILRQALAACRRWRVGHPACGVAVNISPVVLANPALPEEIDAMLRQHELMPGALTVEITETTVISNPLLTAEVLTRLRIKGIALSIDDFGTGHSSLLTLLRLPFTELKIDSSFISVCETDAEAWKIIRATLLLARELGLSVVAEGVESESIEAKLRSAGCAIAQGWRFGAAMAEPDLRGWLARRAGIAA